jgi:hypothetical protein
MKENFKQMLRESPYLNSATMMDMAKRGDKRCVTSVSLEQLDRAYTLVTAFDDDTFLYRKAGGLGFVYGYRGSIEFIIFVNVTMTVPRVGAPKKHLVKPVQVEMVQVTEGWEEKQNTKKTYLTISQHYALISDSEQFLASMKLWQSVARESMSNVYVYDGLSRDYLRGTGGHVIRYDGKNIEQNEIWGREAKHIARLLVATKHIIK